MTFAFDDKFTMFDVTPVENQFILEQLPGAKGDYVKVYLYGLMHCYHPRGDVTPESMSKELDIPVEDIKAAFRYWERHGAVRRISDHPPAWQYVSFKERMMTSYDDVDPDYAAFCRELENAFEGKRVFHGSETAAIYEWKEGNLQLPTEVILMILSHMSRVQGTKFNIGNAEKLAVRMAEENARTEEEAAEVLARDEAATAGMRKILGKLGKGYKPSVPNMKLYVKWTKEWGFTQEAIEAAVDEMEDKDPTLSMLDKILQKAYENGNKGNRKTLKTEDVAKSAQRHKNIRDVMKKLGRSAATTEYQEKAYDQMLQIYPQEIILLGAEECERKKRDPESLLLLLKSWKDRGFTTKEQIEEHIRVFRDREAFLKKLRSRWSSRETDPGGQHMDMLCRWEETLGISREVILKAADFAAEVRRPMAYLDALMTRYAEKGIRTPEEAEQDHREYTAQYKDIARKTAEKNLPAQNYDQRDYSGEQDAAFERMIDRIRENSNA